MIRHALAAAFASLALASVAACDLKTHDSPDAATPEAGSGTIGDQCTRIYTVLCTRAINVCAQTGFTIDQCVASNKQICCVDKCSSAAISTDAEVTSCMNALAQESCNDLVNNKTPAACSGVPKTTQ